MPLFYLVYYNIYKYSKYNILECLKNKFADEGSLCRSKRKGWITAMIARGVRDRLKAPITPRGSSSAHWDSSLKSCRRAAVNTSADKYSLQRLQYFSISPKEDGATSTGKINRERVTTRVYRECRQHLVTQIMYESRRSCQCVCVCVCIICKGRLSDDDVRRSGAHITPRLLSYNLVARTVPWARFPRFIADRTLPLSTVPVLLQVTRQIRILIDKT